MFLTLLILLPIAACSRPWRINEPVEITVAPTVSTAGSLFETVQPTATAEPIPTTTEAATPQTTIVTEEPRAFTFTPTEGEWMLYIGDYEQANQYFLTIFNDSTSTKIQKADALLGLGRIAYLQGSYGTAIDYFDALQAEYALTEPAKRANYFLGEIYTQLDDYETASRAYENFLTAYPGIIDGVIAQKLGETYSYSGNPLQAIEAYQRAQQASQDEYTIDEIKINIAQAYQELGETDLAIQVYLDTYDNTQSAYINAKVNLLLGRLYEELGDPEKAFERYQENITYWPYAYDSYTGLVTLIENEQSVDEYQRGLTDYYAGLYGLAADAFNRYIEATSIEERNGDVHYFNGLSYIYLEQYENAIAQWQILADNFQSSNYWSNATDEIAYTHWVYLNDTQTAAEVYLAFVERYPNHEDSAEFLYYAARMYERSNELELAAQTWERMLLEYPAYPDVFRAQQLAAISYYRNLNFASAQESLNTLLQYASTPEDEAAAHFWLGKTYEQLGDTAQAVSSWEAAYRVSANSFYGIRAEQMLNADFPFSNDPYFNPSIDLAQEREQAATWLRSTFAIGESVDLSANTALANNPTAIRGELFWALGMYQESLEEYEQLREDFLDDPINTFRLLERLVERGHYRAAAFASRHIIDLANLAPDDYLLPPRYLSHLRFATHFEPIVSEAALQYAISPQIIFSQIRQESLFDSRIGSSAGAMGLMQIIPATGDYANNQMQWSDTYQTSDLFLPRTNIYFGTYYIDLQRDYFDGDWIPALSAYNAGPGNTAIWMEMAGDDIDLFVEIVRFAETRSYIFNILETYHAYSVLYSTQ